jgi:hypothetical protein
MTNRLCMHPADMVRYIQELSAYSFLSLPSLTQSQRPARAELYQQMLVPPEPAEPDPRHRPPQCRTRWSFVLLATASAADSSAP